VPGQGAEPSLRLKCLDKEPNHRYASALALAEDLGRYLDDNSVSARPLGEWESARRWARKHPITALATVLTGIGLLLWTALVATVFPLRVGMKSEFLIASSNVAGFAGFLATMAVLVRPHRWVAGGGVLLVLFAIAWPWMMQVCFGRTAPRPAFQEPEVTTLHVLGIPLGLAIGILLAGLFGGMSRWIARRHQSDLLTVFFGGGVGAFGMTFLCACGFMVPLMLASALADRGGDHSPTGGKPPVSEETLRVAYPVALLPGIVIGFWLGGTLVARFTRRHPKPE
jgi:hypothetical protein